MDYTISSIEKFESELDNLIQRTAKKLKNKELLKVAKKLLDE